MFLWNVVTADVIRASLVGCGLDTALADLESLQRCVLNLAAGGSLRWVKRARVTSDITEAGRLHFGPCHHLPRLLLSSSLVSCSDASV